MSLKLKITVVPEADHEGWQVTDGREFRCYRQISPIEAKDDKSLEKYLSKKFDIPEEKIKVVAGNRGRNKTVNIDIDITFREICKKLNLL